MRAIRWMGPAAVGLTMLALSGCGNDVRQALGMTKQSPDEFQVVAHAPLTLPPDYSLHPPQPGAPRPQEGTASDQAKTALFGPTQTASTASGGTDTTGAAGDASNQSSGEVALLQNAGATGIDPQIRAQIDEETAAAIERDKSLIDRLVFWRTPAPYGTVVDPAAESKRLQENAALGKPVTEGETPIIKRARKGLLEDIF
jgi:Protein of unknown function (DUF3035)